MNSAKLQGDVTSGGLDVILGVLLDHLEDDEAEMQHLRLEMTGLISCSNFSVGTWRINQDKP